MQIKKFSSYLLLRNAMTEVFEAHGVEDGWAIIERAVAHFQHPHAPSISRVSKELNIKVVKERN